MQRVYQASSSQFLKKKLQKNRGTTQSYKTMGLKRKTKAVS